MGIFDIFELIHILQLCAPYIVTQLRGFFAYCVIRVKKK